MPTDENGVFHEPTNADRARWAKVALDAYIQAVDGVPFEGYDGGEESTAVKDLLADLMHLVNDEEKFNDWFASARDRFIEERYDPDLQTDS